MRPSALLLVLASLALPAGVAAAADPAEQPVYRAKGAVYRPGATRAEAKAADLFRAAPHLPPDARHALGPLPAEERASLAAGVDTRLGASSTNERSLRPKRPAVRVGLSRALPEPVGFDGLEVAAAPSTRTVGGGLLEPAPGGAAWTAAFSSAGAGALRIHVSRALLPPGSRVYVYSASGEVHGPYSFEREPPPEGFWTNTVFADEVYLEVRLPAGTRGAALSVDAIAHLEHPSFAPSAGAGSGAGLTARPKSDACFIDVSCISTADFPNVAQASDAIAQLTFMDQGGAFVCTGGLLNTTTSSFVPYLLTANHCFDNQASASSLEALWQYRTSSCNGPTPSPSQFPRTLGSTLLATGTTSDFTFVQLSENPPAGSFFLGWDTTDYSHAGGTILHRVSNPDGGPQIYTKEQISAVPDPGTCDGAPQGLFLYEKDIVSASGGGSSGSPVMLPDLSVVGQEYGECGTNNTDNCDVVNNSTLDGAFRVTFPSVAPWLQPASPGACVADANTLCLNNGRFKVTVSYATPAGQNGPGTGVGLTNDSGYFWFFNPANIELVVKVLNACTQATPRYWVFAGGLTNVHVVITVVDTTTGATKTYENPLSTAFVPLQDTHAFPCP
jgi:hypothetical protein